MHAYVCCASLFEKQNEKMNKYGKELSNFKKTDRLVHEVKEKIS